MTTDGPGNVYVVGETAGDLDGQSAGGSDAFIAKYDAAGHRLWARQFGSDARDAATGVSVGPNGSVDVSGTTFGSLGGPLGGEYDAFVARFDADGNRQWLVQVGTAERDLASSVSTDLDGNVYIAGDTFGAIGAPNAGVADAYLVQLDSSGRQVWARQLGTAQGEVARGVATDDHGGVYITGQTDGDMGDGNAGASDAFVARYESDGERSWVHQFGSAATDYANAIAISGDGSIWVGGLTEGALVDANAGQGDAFVTKLDHGGVPVWTKQFGTAGNEQANAIDADEAGGVYVGGYTEGDVAAPSAGGGDALLAHIGGDGAITRQARLGSTANDTFRSVHVAPGGGAYAAGQSGGTLGNASLGGVDGLLVRYP